MLVPDTAYYLSRERQRKAHKHDISTERAARCNGSRRLQELTTVAELTAAATVSTHRASIASSMRESSENEQTGELLSTDGGIF